MRGGVRGSWVQGRRIGTEIELVDKNCKGEGESSLIQDMSGNTQDCMIQEEKKKRRRFCRGGAKRCYFNRFYFFGGGEFPETNGQKVSKAAPDVRP